MFAGRAAVFVLMLVLAACGDGPTPEPTGVVAVATATPTHMATRTVVVATAVPTSTPIPSLTPQPTATATSAPTNTPSPTLTPSPTVAIWTGMGTPMQTAQEVIAAENLDRMSELARWGRGVIQGLTISADSEWVDVETATGAYRQRVADLAAEPQLIGSGTAVFSPQGDVHAMLSNEGRISLWRNNTLLAILYDSEGTQRVQFSADGRWLVGQYGQFGVLEGSVRLWQVDDLTTFYEAEAFAFSADGALVALATDERVVLRQLTDMAVVGAITPSEMSEADRERHDYSREVTALAFSPDGERLAVGLRPSAYVTRGGSAVDLFRVSDGLLLEQISSIGHLEGSESYDCNVTVQSEPPTPAAVRQLVFSPDGESLAVAFAGFDNVTFYQWQVYRAADAARLWALPDSVWSVAFTADSQQLVSGTSTGLIQRWDSGNGRLTESAAHYGAAINELIFGPDGQWLAAETAGGVDLYRMSDGFLSRHYGQATSLAFDPAGEIVAVGYDDGRIEWRQLDSDELLSEVEAHSKAVADLAYVPDSGLLVSAGLDCMAYEWQDGVRRLTLEPYMWASIFSDEPEAAVGVRAIAPLGEGGRLVGLFSGWPADFRDHADVGLWDSGNGNLLDAFPENDQTNVTADGMAVSLSGQILALTSRDGLSVWHFDSSLELSSQWHEASGLSKALAISPDDRLLATTSATRSSFLEMWLMADGSLLALPFYLEGVSAVAFSGDGRYLATGSLDGLVQLWGVP